MVAGDTLAALAREYAERNDVGSNRTLRERLLAEAGELIRGGGWQTLTMGKLADKVGVSRQTVYNEIGSKQQLAQAVVMQQLGLFLESVDQAFHDNPDDIVEAARAASRRLLEEAERNPLLMSVLTRSDDVTDLLALITTKAAPLIDAAAMFLGEHIARYEIDLVEEELEIAVDAIVRIIFSHVTQPSGMQDPEEISDQVAWLVHRVLIRP